jgi:hypothetical protein
VNIKEEWGISIAKVDVDEALSTDWSRLADVVDLVRVDNPPESEWTNLTLGGFVVKPEFITWTAQSAKSVDEFLTRLPRRERKKARAALLRIADASLRTEVIEPLSGDCFERFLSLYDAQVARMDNGIAVARMQQERILADSSSYFVVFVYDADRTVAGAICHMSADEDMVRLRFSATDPYWRNVGLARALRIQIAIIAHRNGYSRFSLGNDPNLYGNVVKPGLFIFKTRLGFTAEPSQFVQEGWGRNVADHILKFGSLDDPAFMVRYSDNPGRCLAGLVLSTSAAVDLRPFQASFLTSTELHIVAS